MNQVAIRIEIFNTIPNNITISYTNCIKKLVHWPNVKARFKELCHINGLI
jgi:hypothetical protein